MKASTIVKSKNISPLEALDLAFDKFGLDGEIIEQEDDAQLTLARTSPSPCHDFYALSFSGKTKSVLIEDTAYVLWGGQTLDNRSHESYPSLWFEKMSNTEAERVRMKFPDIKYLFFNLEIGIKRYQANSFAMADSNELELWYKERAKQNIPVLVRGYPKPEKRGDDSQQRSIYPLKEVPKEFKFLKKGVAVYSPSVVDYIIEQIESKKKDLQN